MNKSVPCQSSQKHSTKRLMSCIAIAAASLGALAAGHKADAALMVFDFDPPLVATVDDLASANPNAIHNRNIWINIGDSSILGGGDANLLQLNPNYEPSLHRNNDGTAGAGRIRVAMAASGTGSIILVPTGTPGGVVRPFAYGDTIGPGLPTRGNNTPMSTPTLQSGVYLNGGQFGSGYIGMRVIRPNAAGQTYYGWVEVSTNAPGAPIATATITRWAIETTPNTPILAGVVIPEPSSFVLMVAGVGALAVKRKRKAA